MLTELVIDTSFWQYPRYLELLVSVESPAHNHAPKMATHPSFIKCLHRKVLNINILMSDLSSGVAILPCMLSKRL